MPLQIRAGAVKTLMLEPIDQFGNPTTVDGVPVWESSDIALITVEATPDGMACAVYPVGPFGTARVTVTAESGADTLIQTEDIEVIDDEVVRIEIVEDT